MKTFILPIGIWLLACSPVVGAAMAGGAEASASKLADLLGGAVASASKLADLPGGAEASASKLADLPGGAVRASRFASEREAFRAACVYATGLGGSLVETSGTPSMEPLIQGKTYAVIKRCPFDAVVERDILVYRGRPDQSKLERITMLHRAVMHDRRGWIMSGDNNRWSESWDRVTTENYIGTVKALFAFPNR